MQSKITLETDGKSLTFNLDNINFDRSRNEAALKIGRIIVDTIYNQVEGV